ncbi:MAG: hypothetical protein A3G25_14150 [Betaproteobacteria bacterium RIFCSPLOWO2_12_FULL_63_13]|nr:MAG: hypothetical protein A3G25_14150 [Betaproteobacteria bacterium RIFCSPLOWO2_12_FULL_63_13]
MDASVAFLLRGLGRMLRARGLEGLGQRCFAHALSMTAVAVDQLYSEARARWEAGDHASAQLLLGSLLKRDPEHARGNSLLGAIHFAREDFAAAESQFHKAISADPALAAAHNNLGNLFLEREDFANAESCYRRALQCEAGYVEALNNLGVVLNRQGQFEAAERWCRQALALRPGYAGALNNLGSALLGQARRAEAIDCFRRALAEQPGMPEAILNLAQVLGDPQQLAGLLDHFRAVLERNPDSYVAHLRVGTALHILGRWDEAEYHLLTAETLRPGAAEALAMRGNNAVTMGDHELALQCYGRALRREQGGGAHSSYLFHRLYDPALAPADFLLEARIWSILHLESRAPLALRRAPPARKQRLRIGYISKDLVRHSVAYFIEPVMAHHDHDRFEIYCYSNHPKPDEVSERIKARADHWRDIAFMADDDLFRQIVADGIDILIDLSGHTSGNRLALLARKPAPILANYLGYAATTGMRAVDYRIVDCVTDPPAEADAVNCETLVRLPDCFVAYQPPPDAPAVSPPPSVKRGYVTFGSFNSLIKVNHEVVALWAKVLHAVAGSRLVLKGFAFSSQATLDRFIEMFAGEGISADRLELMSWHAEISGHLERYSQVDIALDPFPYNGTTTTCEALWMGVPVLTLAGDHHCARVGASLLTAVGLGELVSRNKDEFVSHAVRLGGDLESLAARRTGLRERMRCSPLLDARSFTRNLEAAYAAMWQRTLDGQRAEAPASAAIGRAARCTLELPDRVRIDLPDSLEVMTRYVIEEQGDWFEQEIPFVRALLGPGMNVIDVGANYGAYTLTLGRCVGETGRVWAFEPSPEVAAALRGSCAENDFAHVEVIEAAVAERSGRAALVDRGGAELRQIVFESDTRSGDHQVAVTSLDLWAEAAGWPSIDFIKIDAEGLETDIVRGGRRFFARQSPLVMAEFLNGAERNDGLIGEFDALGYPAWRLVPGLQLLIPVDDETLADAPPLNLFFCKPERARALAAAGQLMLATSQIQSGAPQPGIDALADLFALPYARIWARAWSECMRPDAGAGTDPASSGYRNALAHYASSRNTTMARAARWRHLDAALRILAGVGGAAATLARRLTHARVLYDAGLAARADGLLGTVIARLLEGDPEFAEPFIPPCPRYEQVAPAGASADWLLAACYEQRERVNALTGYLDPAASLRRLRDIRGLGYGDEAIARRIAMIVRRFDQRRPAGDTSEAATTGEI